MYMYYIYSGFYFGSFFGGEGGGGGVVVNSKFYHAEKTVGHVHLF